MVEESEYCDTSGKLAREAGVTVPTIINYANASLLDYRRASDGTRLFRVGQAARVREILRGWIRVHPRKPRWLP